MGCYMNKRILAGAVFMASSVLLSVSSIAFADWDSSSNDGYRLFQHTTSLSAVTSKLYVTECGACHFAYQPGWLPARSWKKMMGSLDNHFGENAELDQKSMDEILDYLVAESADTQPNRKSRKILRSIRENEAPQRISTLRYMLNKHDEIPDRLIKGNPKVGSRANCIACHAGASVGQFNEHGVNIPGYGPWED